MSCSALAWHDSAHWVHDDRPMKWALRAAPVRNVRCLPREVMRSVHLGFVLASVVSAAATSVACGGGTSTVGDGTSSGSSGASGSSSGSSGLSSSTSSGGSSGVVVTPGFTPVDSTTPGGYVMQLPNDSRYDGVVARLVSNSEETEPDSGPVCTPGTKDRRVLEEWKRGEPCGAPANATCTNELACLYEKSGWNLYNDTNGVPSHLFFVFGKAGVLTPVTTRPALLERLLPIDAPAKAFLLFAVDNSHCTRIVAYRAAPGGGFDLQVRGGGPCSGKPVFDATYHVSPEGVITETARITSTEPEGGCSEGRRPTGLVACPRGGLERSVGDYLAEAAFLESAAIVAFEQMADALRSFGAPARLVRAAESARADEIRHARTMTILAHHYGARPVDVEVAETPAHTVESLAIENAVEGCVRETYAVVRAMWQSQNAEDGRIRSALSMIAREELRHAELSWDLDKWLMKQLDAKARTRVEDARRRAIEELRYELGAAPHPEVVRAAGMPDVHVGLRLLDELVARTSLAEAA